MSSLGISDVIVASVLAACGLYGILLVCALRLRRFPRLTPPGFPVTDRSAVTVVIAARNEAAGLGAGLESVLAQRGVVQVVLVDDGSTDETVEVARRFARDDERLLGRVFKFRDFLLYKRVV